MRVLVTGGAGFIGSHVVDALVRRGHDVRVVDCFLDAAHSGPPSFLNPDAEYVIADVRDEVAMRDAIGGIDAVSHQAAMVGLGRSFQDVAAYADINDLGTAILLKCLDASAFCGPLVLGSSMVVYGEGLYHCDEHGHLQSPPRSEERLQHGFFEPACPTCGRDLVAVAVTEDLTCRPAGVYAATKLHQEHLCEIFGRTRSLPVRALRYHNVYGPRMPRGSPYAGVASIFLSRLLAGLPPLVFEDGGQLRDFIHVEDVAEANVLALEAPEDVSGPFNIATGCRHSILEMVLTLSAAASAAHPPQVTGSYRLTDVRHIFASPARAQEELGFRARVSFEDGLSEFVTAEPRAPVTSASALSTNASG